MTKRDPQAALERLVAVMMASAGTLTRAQALAAATEARVGSGVALHAVDRHLAEHPDALVSGAAESPPGVHRLARALHAAGFGLIRPIACPRCGRTDVRLYRSKPEGRVCGPCGRRDDPKRSCAWCGRVVARIAGRRPEGGICVRCFHADPATFKDCAGCGRHSRPYRRLDDGTALCQRCTPRPLRTCCGCGRLAPTHATTDAGSLCRRCYDQSIRPKRLCSRCGRVSRIGLRGNTDHGDVCESCHRGRVEICAACSRERPGWLHEGRFLCTGCQPRPPRICARCGRSRPAHVDWPLGPVCRPCYHVTLSHPAHCARCGSLKVHTGRDSSGAGICGPCAGSNDYSCSACSLPGSAYEKGRCARCVLATRLRALLADEHGNLAGQYATLAAVLLDADKPRSVLLWLKAKRSSQLLRQLTADKAPLTHEMLDDLPPSHSLHYLRRLLVFAAVLPPRQDYLERISPWLREKLRDRPAHHGHLVRPYAEWEVLHRARRRAGKRGEFTVGSANAARSRVTAALELLAWLDTGHLRLDQLTQTHLERWLEQPGNVNKPVKYFLRWAVKRGLTRDLAVPAARRRGAAPAILDDKQRWQQLRRCLHDEKMPLHVRVVGGLTLLLGVITSRILRLTVKDVTATGDTVGLTLGTYPVDLPPRVADLVRRQLDHATTGGVNAPEVSPWLFPGRLWVEPIHPAHMCTLLARHGLDAGEGRHAALVDLAADLPAPVLASLLGVDIATAVAWSARAQRDWSIYLAERREETSTPR